MRRNLAGAFLIVALGGVAAAQQPQPTPSPQTSESKIITGRVISDSGTPIAGASVSAILTSGSQIGARTATDVEGNFKLQGLEPGLYRLFASFPAYASSNPLADPNAATFYRPGDSAALTLVKGGVIAGFITNINNEPVVNLTVRAFRVRDAEGNRVQSSTNSQPRMTDDRGYYRIYGLPPGTYVVSAGGSGQYYGSINPFANDAPTYAPASTRDTAAELIVRADQEVTADIRYRGEPGHVISGKVTGVIPTTSLPVGNSAGVRLIDPESRAIISGVTASGENRTFQINGVSDGEYEIAALAAGPGGPNSEFSSSPSRRISVKGADITGLELTIAPMASISGRVNFALDEKLSCGRRRDNAQRETMIFARRDRKEPVAANSKTKETTEEVDLLLFPVTTTSTPNEKGEIVFRNLAPANYRFEIRTPGAGWYVKELSLGPPNQRAGANRRPASAGPNIAGSGINLKTSEKVSDLSITIAEGGAGLRGRVTTTEGQSVTPGLRLYLIPAEPDQNSNVLRFFEGTVAADNTFALGNIAPGRYWIIAQPAEMLDTNTPRSIKSDDSLRAKILRDAEALKKQVAFKPCERIVDYELSFNPVTSKL